MSRRIAWAVLAAWIIVAAFADVLAHWSPDDVDKNVMPASPPDATHWLGTDPARRDVLALLVHGTRLTLLVGFGAALVMTTIGLLVGVASGYGPRWLDAVLTRLAAAVLSLPLFFLALAVMGVVPHPGVGIVVLTIGCAAWPPLSRVLRAETRRLATLEFVRATEAMGASWWYVARRHIVPHLVPLLGVALAFGVSSAALVEASLSFLGFGVPDALPSWGGLMRGAVQHREAWWLIVAPGLALTSVTVACNVLADRLSVKDPT